jgi:hypothetical protein
MIDTTTPFIPILEDCEKYFENNNCPKEPSCNSTETMIKLPINKTSSKSLEQCCVTFICKPSDDILPCMLRMGDL